MWFVMWDYLVWLSEQSICRVTTEVRWMAAVLEGGLGGMLENGKLAL